MSDQDSRLQFSWRRCWAGLSAQGDGQTLMQQVVAAYSAPQRHYHTTEHLSECLTLFDEHIAAEPAEVEMALWFHDAIYELTAFDNEARSAAWAAQFLCAAGVAPERVNRVQSHILATRHAVQARGLDAQLLVDIDLAILGASRARFEAYKRQIRAEYAWVPEPLFQHKRAQVPKAFLARQPLYNTAPLRAALECRAKENLAHVLGQLRGAGN